MPLKLLLPAMNYDSVEDDEDLHTMWAHLLANAADPKHDNVLPSFVRTLEDLSKDGAVLLTEFYEGAAETHH